MKDDYRRQIETLRQQADGLPQGPARMALLEEAVRLADTHQDLDLGFYLRYDVAQTATFGGMAEKLLVAFSWRLAQCDRHPERFNEFRLMWEYKWVAAKLADFPQITRQQIEDTFDDMQRRYRRTGRGLRAVHKLRYFLAEQMGDKEAARVARRKWIGAPVGAGNDCPACELDDDVAYQLDIGRYRAALEKAEPLLQGRMQCAEMPHVTYARVLVPLLRLDRPTEAMDYHKVGYRMIAGNCEFLQQAAQHLTFLVLTENLPRAITLFEKHLPWALETTNPDRRFRFLVAAGLLFRRFVEQGKKEVAMRLPRDFAHFDESGHYAPAELLAWCDAETRETAARFDKRNGNDSFSRSLEENEKLLELTTAVPFNAPRKTAKAKK
jgi:hypothetical protein